MLSAAELAVYVATIVLIMISPGPNMIYCVSRTLCQGRVAGWISVLGVQAGNLIHITAVTLGLNVLLASVPILFDLIRWAGAVYLLWLAWQSIKPGGRALFEPRELPHDSPIKLFMMGLVTNLLNPKQLVFFMAIFSQFLHPERGNLLLQTFQLASTHITTGLLVNSTIVGFAASFSSLLQCNQHWMRWQRYIMASVLAGLAVKLAFTERK
jgi:threonine/homoserine/homoserine lactone efflux protein